MAGGVCGGTCRDKNNRRDEFAGLTSRRATAVFKRLGCRAAWAGCERRADRERPKWLSACLPNGVGCSTSSSCRARVPGRWRTGPARFEMVHGFRLERGVETEQGFLAGGVADRPGDLVAGRQDDPEALAPGAVHRVDVLDVGRDVVRVARRIAELATRKTRSTASRLRGS